MADENKKPYQVEYDVFIKNFTKGTTSGEDVGIIISKMVQYFADANLTYVKALKLFSRVAKEYEVSADDNGKPLSSAKAKILSAATEEADELNESKAHLVNIEQEINGLKSLQKGVLNEYSHMGMT